MESGSVFDFTGSAKMMRLNKWITHNAVVDLPLRRNLRAIRCDKKVMYIMAYLGSLAGPYSNRDEYVVCRITLLNDRSMIFEPRLTHNGYRIHSKMGEYWAMVHVWDDYFTPLYDQLETVALVPPIPETQCFELPEEEMTQFVTLMNIDCASDFDYKTIWVEYVAHFPDGTTCTSNNTEGQTSQCSMDEVKSFILAYLVSMDQTDYRVECWRPIKAGDNVSELREFFIGQAVDIDFFKWKEVSAQDGVISRAGLSTQSSGTLHISITNIVQRRDYMTRETLNHMKYGAMFGRMGSDLYWRIMKVLMEFEEAKRQLLNVRAGH
ncbi:hypothetical protein ANCDUO_03754 [Ancylostoma duodenale]|uniref:Uncharacterized protein n=1 Tax=Ancylostoma duodenale TaxID=51022 RepID=A0A0C2H8Q7_9BILA|nr:hypothetical protein ANCDUO_03754 [Ancylostoma duodenale]